MGGPLLFCKGWLGWRLVFNLEKSGSNKLLYTLFLRLDLLERVIYVRTKSPRQAT